MFERDVWIGYLHYRGDNAWFNRFISLLLCFSVVPFLMTVMCHYLDTQYDKEKRSYNTRLEALKDIYRDRHQDDQ
jgi:hypothetical protein